MSKFSGIVQFISHEHLSSLKAYFEIELDPLDFNKVSEPPLGCWTDLPLYYVIHVFGWLTTHEEAY